MAVAHQVRSAFVRNGAFPRGNELAHESGRRALRGLFVATDLLLVWLSSLLAVGLRFYRQEVRDITAGGGYFPENLVSGHIGFQLLYSVLVVLLCNTQQLYGIVQLRSAFGESWRVCKAVASAAILYASCIYLSGAKFVSRFVMVLTMLASVVLLTGWRYLRRHYLRHGLADGIGRRNVLIVGTGSQARAVRYHLRRNPHLGFIFCGFLACDPASQDDAADILGKVSDLRAVARRYFIDEVMVSVQDREVVKRVAFEAGAAGLDVRVVPDLYDGLAWDAPIEYVGRFPALSLFHRPIPSVARLVKRAIDVVVSVVALLLLSPVLAAIAIAIKLGSRGQLIYASERVGRKGRTFHCYKFRTMAPNADCMLPSLQHLNQRDGMLFKIANDPRVTRIGRFLRKYSLDELPQLWNVLRGDMSLVGPRPPLPSEVQRYETEHLHRLEARPGMTGLWQVEARGEPSFEKYVSLDVHYVEHWNLWLDAKILFKTVAVVLAGTGQ